MATLVPRVILAVLGLRVNRDPLGIWAGLETLESLVLKAMLVLPEMMGNQEARVSKAPQG